MVPAQRGGRQEWPSFVRSCASLWGKRRAYWRAWLTGSRPPIANAGVGAAMVWQSIGTRTTMAQGDHRLSTRHPQWPDGSGRSTPQISGRYSGAMDLRSAPPKDHRASSPSTAPRRCDVPEQAHSISPPRNPLSSACRRASLCSPTADGWAITPASITDRRTPNPPDCTVDVRSRRAVGDAAPGYSMGIGGVPGAIPDGRHPRSPARGAAQGWLCHRGGYPSYRHP